jgi:1-acyl-sn-glycerol-3-phosphate acyltransferase
MAKREIWKFRPLGWVVSGLGNFPVKRGEPDRNAVRRALDVLAEGAVLGLFPEGHRQRARQLGDIRPGVSLFSLRDGVVTVPVILESTDQIVRKHLLHLPRVTARFGPPVSVPDRDLPHAERAAITSERLIGAFHALLDGSAVGGDRAAGEPR